MPAYQTFSPDPKLGTFVIWANNASTVGIRTEHLHNQKPDQVPVSDKVRLVRVDYRMHTFLRRTDTWRKEAAKDQRDFNASRIVPIGDGTWAMDRNDYALTRCDDSMSHGSFAARQAAVEKILLPLAAWLETPTGKLFTEVGEVDDRAQVEGALDKNLETLETAVRNLLRIKARLAQGRPISAEEKKFARYVRLTNDLGSK